MKIFTLELFPMRKMCLFVRPSMIYNRNFLATNNFSWWFWEKSLNAPNETRGNYSLSSALSIILLIIALMALIITWGGKYFYHAFLYGALHVLVALFYGDVLFWSIGQELKLILIMIFPFFHCRITWTKASNTLTNHILTHL